MGDVTLMAEGKTYLKLARINHRDNLFARAAAHA